MQASTGSSHNQFDHKEVPKTHKTLTSVVYILQILAFATAGFTLIISALINFLKRSAIKGTWLESHFDWQLKTSLFALAAGLVGAATWQFGIGHFILIGVALWVVYRVVRGWFRVIANQPIREDEF